MTEPVKEQQLMRLDDWAQAQPELNLTIDNEKHSYELNGHLTKKDIFLVFFALLLGVLLAALDQTIVGVALPAIVGDLKRIDLFSWVVTSYLITSACTIALAGKISDYFGRKGTFQVLIVIFLVGSIICGIANSMYVLIFGRAIQGVGGGGIMSITSIVIADMLSPRERGHYLGLIGACFAVGSVIGPLVGGYFTDEVNWRWIFFINIPLGAVCVVITHMYMNVNIVLKSHKFDFFGAFVLVFSTACLLLAISMGGEDYAWDSMTIVGLFILSAVGFVVTLLVENGVAEPVLPLRLFTIHNFAVMSIVFFFVGAGLFTVFTFMPYYFQMIHGKTATVSGLMFIPMTAATLVAAVGGGRFVAKTGKIRFFPTMGTVFVIIAVFFLSNTGQDTEYWEVSIYLVLCGFGVGTLMPLVTIIAQNSVTPKDLAVATSAVAFCRTIGAAIGVAVSGAIFVSFLKDELVKEFGDRSVIEQGYQDYPPSVVHDFPPDMRQHFVSAYETALQKVWLVLIPYSVVAFLVSLLTRSEALKDRSTPKTEQKQTVEV